MTDPASVAKLDACPYFQRAKSQLYKGTAVDEQGPNGYGYCYAYGTGYLRVPSVLETQRILPGEPSFSLPGV